MARKNAAPKKRNDTERRFGVILEDIQGKFEQVLEGHAALDTKFDHKIDDFRHEVRSELSFIRLAQNNADNRLKDIEISLTAIRKYLFKIDDEIQDLKKRLVAKADAERLTRIESEVAAMKAFLKQKYV